MNRMTVLYGNQRTGHHRAGEKNSGILFSALDPPLSIVTCAHCFPLTGTDDSRESQLPQHGARPSHVPVMTFHIKEKR